MGKPPRRGIAPIEVPAQLVDAIKEQFVVSAEDALALLTRLTSAECAPHLRVLLSTTTRRAAWRRKKAKRKLHANPK
jgi:hypothetical protein